MSATNKNERLVELLKNWQKLEDSSVHNATEIIKRAENPFLQIVMEIIRQDSVMHRRVQQLIIDHFERKSFDISADELNALWDKIEEHDEMEKRVVSLAEQAIGEAENPFVRYLLEYLVADERKHDELLLALEKFKQFRD